ncbi:MAG: aminodeoxychorismate/anthranilate synthase component II [Candidatus Woesearchaeota archaeon]
MTDKSKSVESSNRAMGETCIRVVYINHYDSFANTIAAYFEREGAEVIMYRSDCSLKAVEDEYPSLIVLGPGPKGPKDAGNYMDVIKNFSRRIPIFGVCLGFQAIMEHFGEKVIPLDNVLHGAASRIMHDNRGIFRNINQGAEFARYHSLGVRSAPSCFEVSAKTGDIVMAARHKHLPVEGIQFHPESILSTQDDSGSKIIRNVIGGLKNGA